MNQIHTIGLYQPFASLMLHGKIETRWVKKGRKPPFPLGKYLVYSTANRYGLGDIFMISGSKQYDRMNEVLKGDETVVLTRHAICLIDLVELRQMVKEDEDKTFVEYRESPDRILWCLVPGEIQRIQPFPFLDGHQGIGFLSEENRKKLLY